MGWYEWGIDQQNIATIRHGTVSVSLYVVNLERTAILIFSMQYHFHQKPGVAGSNLHIIIIILCYITKFTAVSMPMPIHL